jgi:hypothetical protein
MIKDVPGKILPLRDVHLPIAREPPYTVEKVSVQRRIAQGDAIDGNDRKSPGHLSAPVQIEQGRQQLAPGQITGPAENDKHSRFGLFIPFHDPHPFHHPV